jgi:hypothetical protein
MNRGRAAEIRVRLTTVGKALLIVAGPPALMAVMLILRLITPISPPKLFHTTVALIPGLVGMLLLNLQSRFRILIALIYIPDIWAALFVEVVSSFCGESPGCP